MVSCSLPGNNFPYLIVSETADQYQPAINRIFHDAVHPSRLILPIIER
jgi:hypothetical protein